MKNKFILIATLLLPFAADAETLYIVFSNVKNDTGVIQAALFSKDKEGEFPNGFDKGQCLIKAKIKSGVATAICENIAPGKYAISAIHDENKNGELDRNWIGMPKEGYGFSKNVMGKFGPPTYNSASFDLNQDKSKINITMKYH